MKRAFILFFMLCLLINLHAQEVNAFLHKSNCILFRGSVYVVGYEEDMAGLSFKIVQYSPKLEKLNETIKPLGKHKPADLYPPAIDTTHGYLNITIQQSNNEKTADLLRYSEKLKVIASIERAEIAHINSFAAFTDEKIYFKNQLYMVRAAKDTAGRFSLYRYDVRDSSKLFTYDLEWQFNFDKHTYHRIHPLIVSEKYIYLYVICLDGDKKGQWLLRLNTSDGSLSQATRLNKTDADFCTVSQVRLFGEADDLAMAGFKFPASTIDLKAGKFHINYQGSKTVNTFFIQMDSAGEIKTRLENFIPVPNEILKEKEIKDFLFRCKTFEKSETGFNLNYECLYKGKDGIYRTYGFLVTNLKDTPENLLKPENNAFLPCYRNEKNGPGGKKAGNPHGKETADQYDNANPADADRLFYKNAFVKNFTDVSFEINHTKRSASMLSFFVDKKTNGLELYKYTMKNYVWESATFKTIPEHARYNVFNTGTHKFLLFHATKDERGFNLTPIEL